MKYTAIGSGAYERDDGTYWFRPVVNGNRTMRKLAATTKKYARQEVAEINGDRTKAKRDDTPDPLDSTPSATLNGLYTTYLAQDCPTKRLEPRTPAQIRNEKRFLARILEFFGDKSPSSIKVKDCPEYRKWRLDNITKGAGNRTVDMELTSLSNLLNWAVTAGFIDYNFISHNRPRFVRDSEVTHCRERAPESGDELHKLAAEFFSEPRSEVLAWQMLLEAFTGCRTNEVLRLQMDAKRTSEPGYIEGNYLFLNRSKKGVNPFVLIHPALGQLIRAHREWQRIRFPGQVPWWLPGTGVSSPVDKNSLTHGLTRICRNLDIPHRTSHGMRSFYVTVRRSQGIQDNQIAAEIGQTNGNLIRKTYGDCPPNWQGRAGLDWLPSTGEPSWSAWLPVPDAGILKIA